MFSAMSVSKIPPAGIVMYLPGLLLGRAFLLLGLFPFLLPLFKILLDCFQFEKGNRIGFHKGCNGKQYVLGNIGSSCGVAKHIFCADYDKSNVI